MCHLLTEVPIWPNYNIVPVYDEACNLCLACVEWSNFCYETGKCLVGSVPNPFNQGAIQGVWCGDFIEFRTPSEEAELEGCSRLHAERGE